MSSVHTSEMTGALAFLGQFRTEYTIDFTVAAWKTVATHEVFTVTGLVRVLLFWRCTESLLGGAGALAQIAFGVEGETNRYAGAQLCTAIDAGEFVAPAAGGAVTKLETSAFIGHATNDADTVLDGLDIGYEITVEAETDGTIQAICFWTPISSDGAVVVGAGGVL